MKKKKKKKMSRKKKSSSKKSSKKKKTVSRKAKNASSGHYVVSSSTRGSRKPLTASAIYSPRMKSNISVSQVIAGIQLLRRENKDISKIPPSRLKAISLRKHASKKK